MEKQEEEEGGLLSEYMAWEIHVKGCFPREFCTEENLQRVLFLTQQFIDNYNNLASWHCNMFEGPLPMFGPFFIFFPLFVVSVSFFLGRWIQRRHEEKKIERREAEDEAICQSRLKRGKQKKGEGGILDWSIPSETRTVCNFSSIFRGSTLFEEQFLIFVRF